MHVFVEGACPWLDEHLKSYIKRHVPDATFVDDAEDLPRSADATVLQVCDGQTLNRRFAILNTANGLINAYPNSDAVARKDYLSQVVEYWTAKRPDSILKDHVPMTVRLSLDYAEYVDDALAAADDLTLLYTLEENAGKPASERDWWILKPALVDSGSGIRLFSTIEELASHLELAEYETDDEDSEALSVIEEEQSEGAEVAAKPSCSLHPDMDAGDADDDKGFMFSPSLSTPGLDGLDVLVTATGGLSLDGKKNNGKAPKPQYVFKENGRIPSAQMREFVAQRYIVSVPPVEKRKWHIRTYVLSMGRLKVHVYREMLALLAGEDYEPPWKNPSLKSSLTNTALQDEEDFVGKESMRDFWNIADDLLPGGGDWKNDVFDQICGISAELFRAAAHTMADKFTTLDKCFELYALDFLVDTEGSAWLLEVNETPAFYQQGVAGPLSLRLMESVVCAAVEHLGKAKLDDPQTKAVRERMVQVLDETENLARSNITEIMSENF
ncbi:TTL domain-containing protein [Sodiomyces alkalinus F11]|uniref:TTL domain-containing protein n=1 Tax=Sodiomyces alkalinus (strain CBS 110278 / VKM F-3762 / F11) TaxID=1314773 RepID=A0A3N2PUU8_SODAK|nr:TTL domain-containing protein [Sodiomyces alkalinus F11]ROT38126.1 TTL domain-containing protein [Sodiomyces alkalinus F11]